ncbi:hypothetical protein ZWY2020_014330 [Hordeum vulgare]|nr:hypothetical protein ZWY2020_014330 [Hordeum vulgare]
MKELHAKNTPAHRLGSRGYEGKMHVWTKEDAEHESHGIPDPLAEFTDPQKHDWIRAQHKWDPVNKVFSTDPNMREFMRLLKEQHQQAAESDELSQSSARPKWDNPFNRALNILKNVSVDKPPSYGRVHGIRDSASRMKCYHEKPEEKKQIRQLSQHTINEKVAQEVDKSKVETKEELAKVIDDMVNAAVVVSLGQLVPTVFEFVRRNPEKGPEDFPLLSFVGSNSANIAPQAPAHATAHAPVPGLAPVHSSPSSASSVLDGASSLVDLDAITADETLCTLLYDVNGQKVDMGKKTIMKLKDRILHNRQMPHGVFKVCVASLKAGF